MSLVPAVAHGLISTSEGEGSIQYFGPRSLRSLLGLLSGLQTRQTAYINKSD